MFRGEKLEAAVSKTEPIAVSIVEGGVYQISNFRIIPYSDPQRYTRNRYKIIFHSGTRIVPFEDDRIPLHGWSFFGIENILRVGDNFGYLVDVIGVLAAVSKGKLVIKDKRVYKRMVINIIDLTGMCQCVVNGDAVDILCNYLCLDWVNRPTIGLRYVEVKKVEGKIFLNSIPHVSKIYLNHTYHEDWVIGDRFCGLKCDVPVECVGSFDPDVDIKDDMLNCHAKTSISELLKIKERGVAVVKASINAFINDCPWSYNSCWCHMELQNEKDVYRCNRCYRDIAHAVRRYRIKLEVFDGYDNTLFMLNDSQVKHIVGIQCEELFALNQDEEKSRYPIQLVESLLCKELLFKDKFIPSFTKFGDSADGINSEGFQAGVLYGRKSDDFSNIAEIYSSSYGADSGNASINQVIAHRPIKRKLIHEFEDEAHDRDQEFEYVDECVRRKLFENYEYSTGGECSGIKLNDSVVKTVENSTDEFMGNGSKKYNVNVNEEETWMLVKPDVHTDGHLLKKVSSVDGDHKMMAYVGNGPTYGETIKHNEIIDLTLLSDEDEEVSQKDCCLKKSVDISVSSMSDNFVILAEDTDEDVDCVEVIYLSE
ncbi:uncharacterized protein LOC130726457 isoform X2 [Lotus japonicus]|uniref:uncharacterized protein LOC130726457 isoform X2 n=1 Tax=Lotus japonicus TaxID=34305 RepID=UPI00258D4D85|nr:uncharacterized protein LOC130726457 isoform X2 [Lotus japonicus]